MSEILSEQETTKLLATLKLRFENNMHRHIDIKWHDIQTRLLNHPTKLRSVYLMEMTGGQPDVVKYDETTDTYSIFDTSSQTPQERCSLCYDEEALQSRKTNKPRTSAMQMAIEMGVELLDEEQYKYLQTLGEFDLTTSSWIKTPTAIRTLKGAIFADRRYNQVFIYHNGAESYYASRGFRANVTI